MNARKKLLYIGHSYHNKTQSTVFLKELFATVYDVEIFNFDPYNDDMETHFDQLQGREFDVLVLFQIMPDIKRLSSKVSFAKAAFFPMLDGAPSPTDQVWLDYKDMNIINFSKTLHQGLSDIGLSSYYVQYFPKPKENFTWGSTSNVYFWQRLRLLNINIIEKLMTNIPIARIHIHKALDPEQQFVEPAAHLANKVEYSEWYETKADMDKDIEACALYIAPRLYEGIGMSFLEAMAMGRCVVAPNHPTMNEYIVHGETGILYDFKNPSPINITNIEGIQRNTWQYIKEGYIQWEKEKYKVLEWVESSVQCDPPNIKKIQRRKCKYLKKDKYYLFSFIHIISIRYREEKTYYDLFDCIRLLKVEKKGIKTKYYLFGFILVWKVMYG